MKTYRQRMSLVRMEILTIPEQLLPEHTGRRHSAREALVHFQYRRCDLWKLCLSSLEVSVTSVVQSCRFQGIFRGSACCISARPNRDVGSWCLCGNRQLTRVDFWIRPHLWRL
ncbi:hypothetical protein AA313_de0205700 [Arthrobotrys entomopaga]|nr:hypothetical protein AA313_de0205700 [Arthrobotrys entomopaga]